MLPIFFHRNAGNEQIFLSYKICKKRKFAEFSGIVLVVKKLLKEDILILAEKRDL